MPRFTPEQAELIRQKLAQSAGQNLQNQDDGLISEYSIKPNLNNGNETNQQEQRNLYPDMESVLQKAALLKTKQPQQIQQPEVYNAIEPRFNKLRQFVRQ